MQTDKSVETPVAWEGRRVAISETARTVDAVGPGPAAFLAFVDRFAPNIPGDLKS
jgi:hypothetical protein